MNNQYGYILMGSSKLCLFDLVMNIVCIVVVHMVEWVLVQSYIVCAVRLRGIIDSLYKCHNKHQIGGLAQLVEKVLSMHEVAAFSI